MDSVTNSMDVNLSKLWEIVRTGEPGVLQPMGSQKVGHDLVTEQQFILLTNNCNISSHLLIMFIMASFCTVPKNLFI